MQRLATCLLACSLSSMANAQVQRTGDYVSKMDADRDGRVSLVEYQDWLGYAFHGMDRDRDGDGVRNRQDSRPNDPRRY